MISSTDLGEAFLVISCRFVIANLSKVTFYLSVKKPYWLLPIQMLILKTILSSWSNEYFGYSAGLGRSGIALIEAMLRMKTDVRIEIGFSVTSCTVSPSADMPNTSPR